jgi:hypothetical protein
MYLYIAYKWCWFYVRETEFLPEAEVTGEIKYKPLKIAVITEIK